MNTLLSLKARFLALDSACISDALDSLYISGGLQGIKPQLAGVKTAGPAYTVKYEPFIPEKNSFQNAGNYIDDVPAGSIIVVDNQGRQDCTSWGNILTSKALSREIAGTVVYGSIRDLADIRKMGYPLYACNVFMVSGKNRARVKALQCEIEIEGVMISPGDWIFCDDNGALVVPCDKVEEVLRRAENVDKTEQKIICTIAKGERLDTARTSLGYSSPWESQA